MLDKPSRLKELAEAARKWANEKSDENNLTEMSEFEVFNFNFMFCTLTFCLDFKLDISPVWYHTPVIPTYRTCRQRTIKVVIRASLMIA